MSKRFFCALALAFLLCILTACGATKAARDMETGNMNSSQTDPASACAHNLPDGWSHEKRRVRTVVPGGEMWQEITYHKNPIGMEFVLIPAGRFKMGSSLSSEETARRFGDKEEVFADEHPRHDVRISEAFLMGAYELTNAQYRQFRASHYSGDYEGGTLDDDLQPATSVSQDDAKAFCEWLSKRHGVTYRLPTEAEWEYACRAGIEAAYPWGGKISGRWCNFADVTAESIPWRTEKADDGYAATAPVGSFPANGFGLYDMIGNVWEWCNDWFGDTYYAESPSDDPTGPLANRRMNRVLRGGSWLNAPGFCRSAFRMKASQANRSVNNGFRVVVSLDGE